MNTYIIAEIGVNHNGRVDMAKQLVDVAIAAGADAIKLQAFTADALATRSASMASYQKQNIGLEKSQYDMLKELELPQEGYREISVYCKERNIDFLCTPFDPQSVDLIAELVHSFKISSADLTTVPLLRYVAKYKKPMILSTGMATLGDIELGVSTCRLAGVSEVSLLHCTSNYPALDQELNLKAVSTLKTAFCLPVGYSDHSQGSTAAVAAVAMGATILEKHFTLDKNLNGPDHKASLTPEELKSYVKDVRRVETMLGNGIKRPSGNEEKIKGNVRKSIVWSSDLTAETVVTEQHLSAKRPGTGIETVNYDQIIGKKLTKSVQANELVRWNDFK